MAARAASKPASPLIPAEKLPTNDFTRAAKLWSGNSCDAILSSTPPTLSRSGLRRNFLSIRRTS